VPHGGTTIRSGNTSEEHAQVIEYGLALESNPEFTPPVSWWPSPARFTG
jgi:diaminopimelate dehydrogenase